MTARFKYASCIPYYLLQIGVLCLGQHSLSFTPAVGIGQIYDIMLIECSISNDTLRYMSLRNDSYFYVGIKYDKSEVVSRNIALLTYFDPQSGVKLAYTANQTMYFQLETEQTPTPSNYNISTELKDNRAVLLNFTFKAEMINIGYGKIHVSLLEMEAEGENRTLTSLVYTMTSTRKKRAVDVAFNIFVTVLVILNTFATGCVSDLESIKNAVKQRARLLIALVVQFIVIPLSTFGLVRALDVQNELAIGFLFVACIPGGGLGHLAVTITGHTDRELSVLLNTLQLTVPIVLMPVYIYSMKGLFPNGAGEVTGPSPYVVLWLPGLLLPFAVGVFVRHKKADLANGFLNWLIMPFLLLAFILFITLGLYINMYIFSVLDNAALITGGIIPFIGFGIGGGLMLVAKQDKASAKTFAIASAITHSIAAIAAIRFTVPQPDADLMSAGVMWVLFLTPVPLVLMFIFHRIKRKLKFQFTKKSLEEEQKITMMSSFAAITRNAMQIGGFDKDIANNSPKPGQTNCGGAESRMLLSQSQSFNDQPLAHTNNANSSINSPVEEIRIEMPVITTSIHM